jgi:hypothetical protein
MAATLNRALYTASSAPRPQPRQSSLAADNQLGKQPKRASPARWRRLATCSDALFGAIQILNVDIDGASQPREHTQNGQYAQRDDGCHERKAPK